MTMPKLNKHYNDALRKLRKEIKEYVDKYDTLTASQQYNLKRKRDTARKIDGIISDLNKQTKSSVHEYVSASAVDGFLHTMYDMENEVKMNLDFNMLDKRYVEELVNKPVDGKTFTQRLGRNRSQLADVVSNELLEGATQGRGYAAIARNIKAQTTEDYKRALTIARTEGGRVQTVATQKGYSEAESLGVIMQKQWVSSLDSETRPEHGELDGQTVGIDEDFEIDGYSAVGPRMFGDAYMDINCRCTTITLVQGISPKLRRENAEGNNVYDNKTYTQWKRSRT